MKLFVNTHVLACNDEVERDIKIVKFHCLTDSLLVGEWGKVGY
jgi:hypothetical protein